MSLTMNLLTYRMYELNRGENNDKCEKKNEKRSREEWNSSFDIRMPRGEYSY